MTREDFLRIVGARVADCGQSVKKIVEAEGEEARRLLKKFFACEFCRMEDRDCELCIDDSYGDEWDVLYILKYYKTNKLRREIWKNYIRKGYYLSEIHLEWIIENCDVAFIQNDARRILQARAEAENKY